MFVVTTKFRDEYGRESLGELVTPFKIVVEGLEQRIHIESDTDEIDVATSDGENVMIHRIPLLAVIDMKEVALA